MALYGPLSPEMLCTAAAEARATCQPIHPGGDSAPREWCECDYGCADGLVSGAANCRPDCCGKSSAPWAIGLSQKAPSTSRRQQGAARGDVAKAGSVVAPSSTQGSVAPLDLRRLLESPRPRQQLAAWVELTAGMNKLRRVPVQVRPWSNAFHITFSQGNADDAATTNDVAAATAEAAGLEDGDDATAPPPLPSPVCAPDSILVASVPSPLGLPRGAIARSLRKMSQLPDGALPTTGTAPGCTAERTPSCKPKSTAAAEGGVVLQIAPPVAAKSRSNSRRPATGRRLCVKGEPGPKQGRPLLCAA